MRFSANVLAAVVALTAARVYAAPLAVEDFNGYSTGIDIRGANGPSGWGGAWEAGANEGFLQQVRTGLPYTLPGNTGASGGNYLNLAAGYAAQFPTFNYAQRLLDVSVGGAFDLAGTVSLNAEGLRAINADNKTVWGSILMQDANAGTELWLRNPSLLGANDAKFNLQGATPGVNTGLLLYRIEFKPGATDTISVWGNVDLANWTPSSPRLHTRTGDFAFSTFIYIQQDLTEDPNAGSESRVDDIRFGTDKNDVAPLPGISAARTFIGTTDSSYFDASKWQGGNIPNGINAIANFTTTVPSGVRTVTAGSQVQLGALNFNSPNTYRLTGVGLTLANNTTAVAVDVAQGSHQLALPVTVRESTNISVAAGASLAVDSISNPFALATITKSGPGTLAVASINNVGSFVSTGGTSSLGAVTGTGAIVATGGTVTATTIRGGSVSVAPGGTVRLAPGNTVSSVTGVSFNGGGTFDVTNNAVVFKNGDLVALRASVASWLAGGTGISSSLASAPGFTTVGVLSNDSGSLDIDGNPTVALYTEFGSVGGLTTADVLVRYTYKGDTNLDGKLDGTDYVNIIEGYSLGLTGWGNGDIDYDGVVSASDVSTLIQALGAGLPDLGFPGSDAGPGGAGSIPEPSALSGLALVGGLLARRRR